MKVTTHLICVKVNELNYTCILLYVCTSVIKHHTMKKSQESAAGTASAYGLDSQDIAVQIPSGSRISLKNAIFWDVTPWGSYKNRRFGGM
jgi:hypothetical protein